MREKCDEHQEPRAAQEELGGLTLRDGQHDSDASLGVKQELLYQRLWRNVKYLALSNLRGPLFQMPRDYQRGGTCLLAAPSGLTERQEKEFDGTKGPLHEFAIVAGFQDLSSENSSMRVLRSDAFGLTIFANTANGDKREAWQSAEHYVVAFESETRPGLQTEQVIIETDDTAALWRLWGMINAHARRIQHEIASNPTALPLGKTRPDSAGARLEPIDVETIAQFYDPDIRMPIVETLEQLSSAPSVVAFDGFTNAVYSKVDDWLMSLRPSEADLYPREIS